MIRRDRHGRLVSGDDPDFTEHLVSVRLRVVDAVARHVFVDRNAAGAPASIRARVRTEMRPELRRALLHAKQARAALLAGNEQGFDLAMAQASNALQLAQVIFRQPHVERAAKAALAGRRGGRPNKDDQTAGWVRRYDRMAVTHRSLTAREKYEQIASDDLGTDTRWRTVRDRISEYRKRRK